MSATKVLAAALLLGATALAQPDVERARTYFEAASAHYREGQYEDAQREFQRAYELTHHPDILHDLALCEEHLDRIDDAIEHFNRYLSEASPSAADRAEVQARIDRLSARRAQEAAVVPVPTPEPPPLPPPAPDSTPIVPITIFIASGVVAITGAICIGLGVADVSSVENPAPGAMWVDYAGAYGRSAALSTTGFVLVGAAIAGATAGTILLFVGNTSAPVSQASLRVGPSYLGLEGRF